MRGSAIDPVGLNFPVAGSYSSAETSSVVSVPPPTMRTRPSRSRVAVWPARTWGIDPVALNPAGPGLGGGALVAVGAGDGAGVVAVAVEVAAVGVEVGASVAPCDGEVPTPAEQPANTKTATRPPTRRPFARRTPTRRGCPPRRDRTSIGSDMCSRQPVEVRGAIGRTPMHGQTDPTSGPTRIRCSPGTSRLVTCKRGATSGGRECGPRPTVGEPAGWESAVVAGDATMDATSADAAAAATTTLAGDFEDLRLRLDVRQVGFAVKRGLVMTRGQAEVPGCVEPIGVGRAEGERSGVSAGRRVLSLRCKDQGPGLARI